MESLGACMGFLSFESIRTCKVAHDRYTDACAMNQPELNVIAWNVVGPQKFGSIKCHRENTSTCDVPTDQHRPLAMSNWVFFIIPSCCVDSYRTHWRVLRKTIDRHHGERLTHSLSSYRNIKANNKCARQFAWRNERVRLNEKIKMRKKEKRTDTDWWRWQVLFVYHSSYHRRLYDDRSQVGELLARHTHNFVHFGLWRPMDRNPWKNPLLFQQIWWIADSSFCWCCGCYWQKSTRDDPMRTS